VEVTVCRGRQEGKGGRRRGERVTEWEGMMRVIKERKVKREG